MRDFRRGSSRWCFCRPRLRAMLGSRARMIAGTSWHTARDVPRRRSSACVAFRASRLALAAAPCGRSGGASLGQTSRSLAEEASARALPTTTDCRHFLGFAEECLVSLVSEVSDFSIRGEKRNSLHIGGSLTSPPPLTGPIPTSMPMKIDNWHMLSGEITDFTDPRLSAARPFAFGRLSAARPR